MAYSEQSSLLKSLPVTWKTYAELFAISGPAVTNI